MRQFAVWIVTLSLTTLIPITTKAKVYKPAEVTPCAKHCDALDWDRVLVIDEDTLKALTSDANGYKIALENLVAAQEKLNDTTEELNASNVDKAQLLQQLRDSEHPPWYKSPSFWGATGTVLGVIFSTLAYVAASKI